MTNEDLAFNREETREFFARTRKITLKAAPLDKIREATEGWVGGLILLTEILGEEIRLSPRTSFYRTAV